MRKNNEIKEVLEILQKGTILPGSLNKVSQKTPKQSSSTPTRRSYWYLTWKESGKSRATYIPSKDVPEVSRGIENMKKVKDYLSNLAAENLKRIKEERDVRKS